MTDEARERLMEAVTGAIDAYVEDVMPSEPDTGHTAEEDWGRPMDYDEFDDLCIHIPTSLISHVTGISKAHVRNFYLRRCPIPPDVASKMRRLCACIESLASEEHRHTRGGARTRSSLPPDTGKRQQKKSK